MQNQSLNLRERVQQIQSRNSDIKKKFTTIQDLMREKEIKNLQEFIQNERKRKRALENKK